MRSFFTPFAVCLALGLTAAAASAANAPARGADGAAAESAGAITVDQVQFQAVRDQNSKYQWMQVSVDVTARSGTAANRRWLDNVSLNMTVGWGSRGGQQAQIEAAVSSAVQMVGLEVNTRMTIIFFIAPEYLQSRNISPSTQPTYYAVQLTVGGQAIKMDRSMVSSTLTNEAAWDGFMRAAGDKLNASRGAMIPGYDAPPTLYVAALGRGNVNVPTFIRGQAR